MSRKSPALSVYGGKLVVMYASKWYNSGVETDRIIVRRSARKTLSLSVNREGEAIVLAPLTARRDDIARFVQRHADWIARRRMELELARIDLADGSRICICGKDLVIATGARARISSEKIYLPAEGRERALTAFLKRITRERMLRFTREYAFRYGFSYRAIRVSSARGRWGSCSTNGVLSFSFRTALLTDGEARYIVVHELCHTRHMDHSRAFWHEVGAIIPDYASIRKGLRKRSAIMLFL